MEVNQLLGIDGLQLVYGGLELLLKVGLLLLQEHEFVDECVVSELL